MPSHADSQSVDDGFDALSFRYADARMSVRAAVYSERTLWCAVIAQAFVDIGAIVPATFNREAGEVYDRDGARFNEAIGWLLHNTSDFNLVCDLAGVSPHVIRCAAKIFHGRRQLALGALHPEEESS